MKRFVYCFLALVIGTLTLGGPTAYSQTVRETVKDELSAFRNITLGGDFELELRYGKQYQARVEAEELLADYVLFSVSDGTLGVTLDERKVPTEVKRLFRGRNATTPTFRVTVTMPESLSGLKLEDRATLVSADELVANPEGIDITVADNAVIKAFTVNSSRVGVKLERKAEAQMNVTCDSLDVQMAGTSSLTLTQHAAKSSYALSYNANLVSDGDAKALEITTKGASKAILNGIAGKVSYEMLNASNVNAVNLMADEARVEMSGMCSLTQAASEHLYVELSGGATLSFLNDPAVHVVRIKGSTMQPYDKK
ncbi:MAG: DUF2807 domain-containing protein [Bacteroidales bacterium]|nr:DUF2807 domain-containing protein [Bacteroidales bacterium]